MTTQPDKAEGKTIEINAGFHLAQAARIDHLENRIEMLEDRVATFQDTVRKMNLLIASLQRSRAREGSQ